MNDVGDKSILSQTAVTNNDVSSAKIEHRSMTRKYHLIKVFECVVILIVLIRKIFDVQFDFKTIK